MNRKLYVAYGSNLNLEQMAMRCPSAQVIGRGILKNYQLTFRSVATIEPQADAVTPVGVWWINPKDEKQLDIYEGYPNFYRKEELEIELYDGEKVRAMVYIMNGGKPALPSMYYYQTIEEGYRYIGLDQAYLERAIDNTIAKMK